MKDIECPYCGAEEDYFGDPMGQDDSEEFECSECKKNFIITCSYSVSYDCEKADCLNGSEHDWIEIPGYPKEYFNNKRRCKRCGKEIELKKEVQQ